MLKNFFISMLGAIAGFWISLMLLFLVMVMAIAGSVASMVLNSSEQDMKVEKGSILRISLDTQIEERHSPRDIQAFINEEPEPQTLENLIYAIKAAKEDDRIVGIFLNCNGASAGLATRQTLANALTDFKTSKKWILAYGDNYNQGDYYVASCADHLYLNPSGSIDLRGLATSIPFFKGLLDKVGVTMQVYKVGTYKSAVEPFILDNMSDANREMSQYFLNSLWKEMGGTIAKNRKLTLDKVNMLADSLVPFDAPEQFVKLKLVDGLKYVDQVEEELKKLTNTKKDDDLKIIDYDSYLVDATIPHSQSNDNKIAVFYAVGDITDAGVTGITAEKMVPEILDLAEDDDIKAMVLRVNSGGGSAFASEQIWHALEVFKSKGKTLYVSMGDYAASGGYYISCGAERIFAEPTTLTGSIGIFGMIPCAKELFNDKLGVNFGVVTTNAGGAFPNIIQPATPAESRAMQGAINRGYELFTSRCATGRNMPQDSIKAIGEGRVWDGVTAKRIGLVDQLGSLDDAVASLAKKMGYKDYQVITYPEHKANFWDMLATLSVQAKASALKEELGAYYPIYMELKRFENLEPIQARMLPMTVH